MAAPNPRFDWWRKAVKAAADGTFKAKLGTPELPLHADTYNIGYFRILDKGEKRWKPVGIYPVAGVDIAKWGGKDFYGDLIDLFHWACKNPVNYAAYLKAVETGEWDDEPPINEPSHNTENMTDFEKLELEYQSEKEQCEEFLKKPIASQADADKVAIWKDRLVKIASRADGFHKVEKEPHLTAGRKVDDKWRTLKEEPGALGKKLIAHLKPFLDARQAAEDKRAREAAAEAQRIEDERIAAERKAREEQEKIAASTESAVDRERLLKEAQDKAEAEQAELAAQQSAAAAAAKPQKATAGRTGARVSSRKDKVGRVHDYEKAALALVRMPHKEIKELIDTLANRAAKGGIPFDGMTIEEETRYV